MDNHIHIIWQIKANTKEKVQMSFLKFMPFKVLRPWI